MAAEGQLVKGVKTPLGGDLAEKVRQKFDLPFQDVYVELEDFNEHDGTIGFSVHCGEKSQRFVHNRGDSLIINQIRSWVTGEVPPPPVVEDPELAPEPVESPVVEDPETPKEPDDPTEPPVVPETLTPTPEPEPEPDEDGGWESDDAFDDDEDDFAETRRAEDAIIAEWARQSALDEEEDTEEPETDSPAGEVDLSTASTPVIPTITDLDFLPEPPADPTPTNPDLNLDLDPEPVPEPAPEQLDVPQPPDLGTIQAAIEMRRRRVWQVPAALLKTSLQESMGEGELNLVAEKKADNTWSWLVLNTEDASAKQELKVKAAPTKTIPEEVLSLIAGE